MIYAPPQLRKHAAAIERLRRADRVPQAGRPEIWRAERAGNVQGVSVTR